MPKMATTVKRPRKIEKRENQGWKHPFLMALAMGRSVVSITNTIKYQCEGAAGVNLGGCIGAWAFTLIVFKMDMSRWTTA